ncbi:hypothetical protein [Verrucomicrobium sp. BvORR106]|uniref:hypothetical protein n=1 Tax=Verrucomicrobium sp. BvORR106 TaxID=1403819 RepID=UPI00056EF60B|nr:hypothetical protein [Verrucomicrobium sp. BvORR106]
MLTILSARRSIASWEFNKQVEVHLGRPLLPGGENSLVKGTTRLGLLLNANGIASLSEWDGLEHDIYEQGERVFPISRHGVLDRNSR